jgi:nitroimidazol reductase NimA-like FMN-containing flavoprotein (pyridoxamine 5'-phosphate oxidase superfamily)
MPKRLTEQEQQQFLAEKHIAVLSIPSDDERPPLAFPVWYAYEPGGDVAYYTHRTDPPSRKLRLLHEGTPVSFCIQREALPYKYVTVEGTVVAVSDDPTVDQMLAIVRRYLPEEAARAYVEGESDNPDIALVLFTIRPERWSGFEFGDEG